MKYLLAITKPLDEKGEKALKEHKTTKISDLEYALPDEEDLIMASESLAVYSIPHKALVIDPVLDTTREVYSPWAARDRIEALLETMSPMFRSWTFDYLLVDYAMGWKREYRDEMLCEAVDRAIETANEIEDDIELKEREPAGKA